MQDLLEDYTPVAEWPTEIDERVLLYVVHDHSQWEADPVARREKWEEWCIGYWTDFNGGGWVWNGICGHVTHVAPMVTEDDGSGDIIYPNRPSVPNGGSMSNLKNTDEMRRLLRSECDRAGSQKAWADENSFSAAYISDVLLGHRGISSPLAEALGYQLHMTFHPIKRS